MASVSQYNTFEKIRARYFTEDDGCWNWRGPVGTNGYAKCRVQGKHVLGHRYVYEQLVGPIPDGFQIDHLCRNRACVNPGHLEAVTPAVNVHRCESPAGKNSRKTHCVRGHSLVGSNVYVPPKSPGKRECRACRRAAVAAHQRRIRSVSWQ